jgi:alpha-amylase
MKNYSVLDIGQSKEYFDETKNKEIMEKVARKCYIPTNKIILSLLNKYPEFKVTYSITGTAIEQFKKYTPEVLESFKELAKTGKVEFLAETYYHSLAAIFSDQEFKEQIELHKKTMKELFNQEPKVFRNTELIMNNVIARKIKALGFNGILMEGTEKILGWRSPNYLYNVGELPTLMKNYKLSDDIAFRFSNKDWKEHPLTTEKFIDWIRKSEGETINLFMDYETFGEHQWEDTGIFNFLKILPETALLKGIGFRTVSEALTLETKDNIEVPTLISWADVERDTSAWLGNEMQDFAAKKLYSLEKEIRNNKELQETWRKLSTSDHFYYMCTKWFQDGDVHKYFNPYNNPYDAFIAYMNILADITERLKTKVTQ